MRFKNGKEMYDYVASGSDLYSPSKDIYIFVYNDADALCYYDLNHDEVLDILNRKGDSNEYWCAYLGFGGDILDESEYDEHRYSDNQEMRDLYLQPSYDFCEDYYNVDDWMDINDVTIDFIKSLMEEWLWNYQFTNI